MCFVHKDNWKYPVGVKFFVLDGLSLTEIHSKMVKVHKTSAIPMLYADLMRRLHAPPLSADFMNRFHVPTYAPACTLNNTTVEEKSGSR